MFDCLQMYRGKECEYDSNVDYEEAIDVDNFDDMKDATEGEREALREALVADLPHLCPEHDPTEWVYV